MLRRFCSYTPKSPPQFVDGMGLIFRDIGSGSSTNKRLLAIFSGLGSLFAYRQVTRHPHIDLHAIMSLNFVGLVLSAALARNCYRAITWNVRELNLALSGSEIQVKVDGLMRPGIKNVMIPIKSIQPKFDSEQLLKAEKRVNKVSSNRNKAFRYNKKLYFLDDVEKNTVNKELLDEILKGMPIYLDKIV